MPMLRRVGASASAPLSLSEDDLLELVLSFSASALEPDPEVESALEVLDVGLALDADDVLAAATRLSSAAEEDDCVGMMD